MNDNAARLHQVTCALTMFALGPFVNGVVQHPRSGKKLLPNTAAAGGSTRQTMLQCYNVVQCVAVSHSNRLGFHTNTCWSVPPGSNVLSVIQNPYNMDEVESYALWAVELLTSNAKGSRIQQCALMPDWALRFSFKFARQLFQLHHLSKLKVADRTLEVGFEPFFLPAVMSSLYLHRFLVLDEADRMLDLGFEPHIRAIANKTRADRQTLMFSATWPPAIQRLASEFLSTPVRVTIGSADLSASHSVSQVLTCSS